MPETLSAAAHAIDWEHRKPHPPNFPAAAISRSSSATARHRPEQGFGVVLPNEIQINGTPVLVPSDRPVIVHEIALGDGDLACMTLTLLARRVFIGAERAPDSTENRS
ncbi:hypothetical protein [Nocardia sp. NPDC059239]|uniref:hypothetical protein n=1 Tax=Nocardia sp. NPDC059239 TaxID=3346785 RepID=UPI0036C6F131